MTLNKDENGVVLLNDKRYKYVWYTSNYLISEYGDVYSIRRKRHLKPNPDKDGYLRVYLSGNGAQLHCYIHQLVLEAWVGPCPEGYECSHRDHNILNNHKDNLRYLTHEDNMLERHKNKTYYKGEQLNSFYLSEYVVKGILILIKAGWTYKEVAKEFGTTSMTVQNINLGKSRVDVKLTDEDLKRVKYYKLSP